MAVWCYLAPRQVYIQAPTVGNSKWKASDVGKEVEVAGYANTPGTIAWVGKNLKGKARVGVVFSIPIGTTNGWIKNRRHFDCNAKHGVYVINLATNL